MIAVGSGDLVMTPLEFKQRLVALVPPPRALPSV
jgi:hypothetical protein